MQHLEAALAADRKKLILEVPVLRLFCVLRSNEVHSKKVKKWDQKTGPELRPIFGAC